MSLYFDINLHVCSEGLLIYQAWIKQETWEENILN